MTLSKQAADLYDFIKTSGRDVLWQTELENFTQDESGVKANFKNASGETGSIEAKYLVGCDGAKSVVRRALGLQFEGSTFERLFYVADVEIDWKFSHNALTVFLLKNNLLVFFPMVGENRHRIVGTFPEEFAKDEGDVLYEEIEEQIKKDSEVDLDIKAVNWFSTYKVHSRRVNKFSVGRCFLAGDSAHVHTPAGAQGMNTGIQDGYNLAWKLALVLRGKAGEKLLETYNEERLENAENLLKTTDRLFNLVASPEPVLSYLRTHIFPAVAGVAFSIDAVLRDGQTVIFQVHYLKVHNGWAWLDATPLDAKTKKPTTEGGTNLLRLESGKWRVIDLSSVPEDPDNPMASQDASQVCSQPAANLRGLSG